MCKTDLKKISMEPYRSPAGVLYVGAYQDVKCLRAVRASDVVGPVCVDDVIFIFGIQTRPNTHTHTHTHTNTLTHTHSHTHHTHSCVGNDTNGAIGKELNHDEHAR